MFRYLATAACVLAANLAWGADTAPPGERAVREMRYIASQFAGRLAGSDRDFAASEYLYLQLASLGYHATFQPFDTEYQYVFANNVRQKRLLSSRNVVAVKPGRSGKVIVVGAHLDTATTQREIHEGVFGGPELQGLDDNASGLGVLLELARSVAELPAEHTLVFIGFGAEELGRKGSQAYLASLTPAQRANILLMINLDSLLTGDQLYFTAGKQTTAANPAAGAARDRALALATSLGIAAATNPGRHPDYPAGTGCCSDQETFDQAGIPVLALEATSWTLGQGDGYTQTSLPGIPGGSAWHRPDIDNLTKLPALLPPGRIEQRARDSVKVLMSLLRELAGVAAP
ncbi:MAG: aminopeptidase [Vogesella sp.]|uniref:aminopeptidase n=1 Tax=Vogesella sp. TaxID=1904252 RepID=UPI00391DAFBC